MQPSPISSDNLIRQMRQRVLDGTHWYRSFLEMLREWDIEEESIGKTHYRYIISSEALDVPMIASRALLEIFDLIEEEELDDYLSRGIVPVEYTQDEIKEILGDEAYKKYLNYFYGVILEECLIRAYEESIIKGHVTNGLVSAHDAMEDAVSIIYGRSLGELIDLFCREKGYILTEKIEYKQMKEFYYWLFIRRIRTMEPARTASDTQKAIDWLNDMKNRTGEEKICRQWM